MPPRNDQMNNPRQSGLPENEWERGRRLEAELTEAQAVKQRAKTRRVLRYAAGGVLGIVTLATIASGLFSVHERERAVVTRNGGFSYVAGPGLHLKAPWIDGIELVSLGLQTLTLTKLETFTSGAQPQHVDLDITVQWQVPAESVERVFRQGRNVDRRLQSMVIDRAKIEVGQRHAEAIPTQRAAIVAALLGHVREQALSLYGVEVVDLQLVNFDYSPEYRRAVDLAAVAQQNQARTTADAVSAVERAKGEANAAIEAARGRADSQKLEAQAQADAIRLRGEAEAASIEAQAKALGSNPLLVQLRTAERWNGTLPQNLYASAPIPLLTLPGQTASR